MIEGVSLAQGYMGVEEFLAFLNGSAEGGLGSLGGWAIALIFLGGMAMNLTPCVLPMIPINVAIIGKSVARGAWYGLGMAMAYGVMGIFAAVGGMAFGEIQGRPVFNFVVAGVFLFLALAMSGVVVMDFGKWRGRLRGGAFWMGVGAAVLAGACVAPMLVAVLVWTAALYARGVVWALGLPFVFGLGMGAPWPFVGAGLRILPRPGRWMKGVKGAFVGVLVGMAAWYGWIGWRGVRGGAADLAREEGVYRATVEDFERVVAGLKRPILVDCWATWCKNCAAMERTTLKDARVQKELKKYSIIKLQAEKVGNLRKIEGFEGVMGLPAYLILK